MLVNNVSEDLTTAVAKKNWLSYWRYYSANNKDMCAEAHCHNHQDYGMLIIQDAADFENVCVIPLCKMHSDNFNEQLNIAEDVEMIPSNFTL